MSTHHPTGVTVEIVGIEASGNNTTKQIVVRLRCYQHVIPMTLEEEDEQVLIRGTL
jgi:hypothetical protein